MENTVINTNTNNSDNNNGGGKIFFMLREILEVVVISLLIVIPIRYFLVQPFFVKGASMEPNFKDGEYLIVDEISYRLGEPKRGDVIVFKYPLDPSQYYIKRIVGLPEETIAIRDGKITIFNNLYPDGFVLNEVYLPQGSITNNNAEARLGNKEYFVLGDNRTASFDSRRWGTLSRDNIIGKAALRAWPFASAQLIYAPNY